MKRLELADGSVDTDPSPDTLAMVIGNLGRPAEFLVLRETRGGFVQAAAGARAGTRGAALRLETAGDHLGYHGWTEVPDRDALVAVFQRYLAGDTGWVSEFDWRTV